MLNTKTKLTLEAFAEALRVERAAAKATVDAYLSDLRLFFLFHKELVPEQIAHHHIESYLRHLYDVDVKTATVQRALSALRQLFIFLASENRLQTNPMDGIKTPKSGRSLPKTLTEADVDKLLETASKDTTPEGARLISMLEVLYASGLRVSELVSLPLSSLVRNPKTKTLNRIIRVTGKGNKERLAPLSHKAIECLEDYLNIRSEFDTTGRSTWLWPSRSKQGYLTRQHFARLLKQLASRAGLALTAISPHVLRHAFATHLLKNGADILSIQKLLGHADIATTQIYTHVVSSEVEDLLVKHHPLVKQGLAKSTK